MTIATWLVLLLKDRSCVHQVCLTCEASIEPCLHFTDALVLWYFHSLPPPLTLHAIWRNVDFYVPRDCVQRDIQGLEITVPLDKWCNYSETAKKWTWLLCCFKFRNRREERDNSRVLRSCSRVKEGRGVVVVVGHVLLSYIFRADPLGLVYVFLLVLYGCENVGFVLDTARQCKQCPFLLWLLFAARLSLQFLIMKNNTLEPR